MLKLKQKLHIHLPHLSLKSRRMRFSNEDSDHDELLNAIDSDVSTHDDNWQLAERPDTEQLTEYWEKVEDDIQHDPLWVQIDE